MYGMSKEELADLRAEFPPKKPPYRCHDGFCGAEDCDRCHPGCDMEDEK